MLAEQHLRDGNLTECLSVLHEQVRNDPSDSRQRIFLFQLLCVLGDWERASTQLDVLKDLEVSAFPMVQTYREVLKCEVLREAVFAGKHNPTIFGEPQQWMALLMEALRLTAQNEFAKALELREQAFQLAPATAGEIDSAGFLWIADADSRLGPVLEVIINGTYYWVPFDRISEIHIEKPEDLRDFVWTPAHFIWTNGGETVGLIPSRYPGTQTSDDSKLQLARKTDWIEPSPGYFEGLGQRIFSTDTEEYPLFDVREIKLHSDEQTA